MQMSESLTIGIILTLVFGAIFYYLYSRVGQSEKRVSLLENILLDLKVAMESTLIRREDLAAEEVMRAPPTFYESNAEVVELDQESEALPAEVPASLSASLPPSPPLSPLAASPSQVESSSSEDPYDKMSNKELKDAAKARKVKGYTSMVRSELQDALRSNGSVSGVDMNDGVMTLDA
jgi:hypothetical protein